LRHKKENTTKQGKNQLQQVGKKEKIVIWKKLGRKSNKTLRMEKSLGRAQKKIQREKGINEDS